MVSVTGTTSAALGIERGSESRVQGRVTSSKTSLVVHAIHRWLAVLFVFVAVGFNPTPTWSDQAADVIFVGGHIVTVDEAQPTAEAIAIEKDKIVAVGDEQAILRLRKPSTRVIRLSDDQTLLPGMIESHALIWMPPSSGFPKPPM